jgi:tetratricopeptide (TPR) repeat protein
MDIYTQAFRVALSFPGEHRDFVEKLAERLAAALPREAIFYDRWYEAHLAVPNLDTLLQDIYRKRADLVVAFFCKEYDKKEWCRLEWRAIRDVLKQRDPCAIMPVRFDDIEIPGIFSIDGYVSVNGRTPEMIADLILRRLNQPVLPPPPKSTKLWRWLTAGLASALALWLFYVQPAFDRRSAEAEGYLSSGQYARAAERYRAVLFWEPWRREARRRRDIAELGQEMTGGNGLDADRAGVIDARLEALREEAGDDPHFWVLDGLRLYHSREIKKAENRYRDAIRRDDKLAEAHFNLGVSLADSSEAEIEFCKARDSFPGSVAYSAACASAALERGDYKKAVERYRTIPAYPLALLEEAKAHWALGDLDKAEARQNAALGQLRKPEIDDQPWNRYPWDFAMDEAGHFLSLRSKDCKRYYAALTLAATRHLRGKPTDIPESGVCGQTIEIRQAIAQDLRRYAMNGTEERGETVQAFMTQVLGQ